MSETLNDRLYFRQLLSGRDFAQRDQVAAQMVNFVYLIGDRKTRECIVVDPAYAVDDILNIVEQDSMKLTGVLATHYHPDHVGGSMMGMKIQGVADLLEKLKYQFTSTSMRRSGWLAPLDLTKKSLSNMRVVTRSQLAMLQLLSCIRQVIPLGVNAFGRTTSSCRRHFVSRRLRTN